MRQNCAPLRLSKVTKGRKVLHVVTLLAAAPEGWQRAATKKAVEQAADRTSADSWRIAISKNLRVWKHQLYYGKKSQAVKVYRQILTNLTSTGNG
jgi:hypothetical protein